LATSFAEDNHITDISWNDPEDSFWDDIIAAGEADVVWGGGPTIFDQLMVDGRLYPLTSAAMQAAAARVPDEFGGVDLKRNNTADQLAWVAAAVSTFGFTTNNYFLNSWSLDTPYSWSDLGNWTYGQYLPTLPTIAISNAPFSSSNRRCYEIISQGYGWEEGWDLLARIAGNSQMPGGSSSVKAAVDNGAVGVAMSIDFYGYQSAYDRPGVCEYIVPSDYTVINGDPIAIAATSTQKDLAEVFVDYVLSAEGQAVWLDPSAMRLPVIEGAFAEPVDPANEALRDALYLAYNTTKVSVGLDFNDTESLSVSNSFKYYFEAVFYDAQTDLVDCWNAIVYARMNVGGFDDADVDSYAAQMSQILTVGDYNATIHGGTFDLALAQYLNPYLADETVRGWFQTEWMNAAISLYNSVQSTVPT
jgi:ABC-type Fe3+ transport system substrate-binding protein